MLAGDRPQGGDASLPAVSEALAALLQREHHTPLSAKAQMLGDDLLACVLGGVSADVEKTMAELQRSTIVAEVRAGPRNHLQREFIEAVERLSRREVLAFNHRLGPAVEIELFVLAPAASDADQESSASVPMLTF